MSFKLPKLPYPYDALEPYLDAQTLEIHHSKHHQGYVDKLNTAAEQLPPEWASKSIEDLLTNLNNLPARLRLPVQNAGGGHANHSLFWTLMSPRGGNGPNGELADILAKTFGSVDDFKDRFTESAIALFGSGWTWLTADNEGQLSIINTSNQETPLSQKQIPLLTIDVWEHAYYLKYQNRRPEYIEAFWNIVNWQEVQRRYGEAR